MREILTKEFESIAIRYIGRFPQEKAIFFYFGKEENKEALVEVYRSTIEAIFNGYSVFYTPSFFLSSAVEKAFKDTLFGRLYSFIPKGLESVSKEVLSKALITGGGVLSIVEDSATFSYEALTGIRTVATLLSNATIVCSSHSFPFFLENALNNGKDIAILKSALLSKKIRQVARDGACVIDSFSSFLSDAVYLTYPKEKGEYKIQNREFDIMRLDYGK